MKNRWFAPAVASLLLVCTSSIARAAEWQWSVPVQPKAESPNERPRAYLWIPPNCQRIRGVVLGQHNMEEQPILEHPVFRRAAAEIGFAEVWVAPKFDGNFRFDQDAGPRFEKMMKDLADESGYSELVTAPIVPVGHSACASFPWYFAAWKPERTLACISFSGQWPYVPDEKNAPQALGKSVDTVPGIVTAGEYEWADESMGRGLKIRAEHPALALSGLGCPADGHFAVMEEKVGFLSLYLKKAALYRLPKTMPFSGAPKLNPIDPAKTGWLVDTYHKEKLSAAPAAPVGEYKGDASQAFWYFDGEIAKAAQAYQERQRGQAPLVGYVQEGHLVPQTGGHAQVSLNFAPLQDGVTFKLSGTFLETVPGGRPVRWSGKKEGEAIEKPAGGPPVEIRRITGPIRQITEDTWELAFDRTSLLGDPRGNEAWLAAVWPGDGKFKRAIQQAVLRIPLKNATGTLQAITFNPPAKVSSLAKELKLSAKSDAGLPVRFYVREGPAEVEGSTLKLLPVPPRAKYPVKVTVVAWQFGTMSDPRIQSAEPVEKTILVTR
jgi:hypothetical protein